MSNKGVMGNRTMKVEPRFYENWPDNSRCLQAAVMSVLNTIGKEVTWDDVNAMTQYEGGLYSWASTAAAGIARLVPGMRFISRTDFKQFVERGEEYLKGSVAPDWFELQKRHASGGFQKERKAARYLVEHHLAEQRDDVTKEEVTQLLEKNLLIALVNVGVLVGGEDAGHFLVMYGEEGNHFLVHDPGLPPRRAWRVNKDNFMSAFRGALLIISKGNVPIGSEIGRNDPCWCGSGKKYKKCPGQ